MMAICKSALAEGGRVVLIGQLRREPVIFGAAQDWPPRSDR
jgi:hypothetical protein